MELSKAAVLELVRAVGRQDDAARAETELPDPVDTDRDAAALERVGLDAETLAGHLRPDGQVGPTEPVGPAGGASTGRLLGRPADPGPAPGDGDTGTSDAGSGDPGLPGGPGA